MVINNFIASNEASAPDQVWALAGQGDGDVSSTSTAALGLGLVSAVVEELGLTGPPGTALPCLPKPLMVESKAELGSESSSYGEAAITC